MTMVTNMVFIGDTHVLVEKLFFGETHIEFMGFIGWETFTQCWYPSRVQLHSNKCPLVTQRACQVQTDRCEWDPWNKEPHPERTSHEMNVRGHWNVQNNPQKQGNLVQNDIFSILPWEHVEGLERNIADDHLLSVRPPTLRSVAPSNVDHRWEGSLKFRLWQEKTHLFGNKTCFISVEGETRFRNFGWNTTVDPLDRWSDLGQGQVLLGLIIYDHRVQRRNLGDVLMGKKTGAQTTWKIMGKKHPGILVNDFDDYGKYGKIMENNAKKP